MTEVDGVVFRVATVNLLHGRSLQDGLVSTDRFTAEVAGLRADVVGLQEVDRGQPRSGHVDQTQEIASAMAEASSGPAFYRFVPAIIGEPGGRWTAARNTDPSSGDDLGPTERLAPSYGIGLISRVPVQSWHVIELRHAPVKSPIVMPGTRRPMLLADEPRRAIAAVFAEGTAPFRTVATTHLSFVPGWNIRQLHLVQKALLELPGPRLILGDLNMPAGVVRLATRWTSMVRAPTFPSPDPKIQFDHMLTDDSRKRPRSSEIVHLMFSDHRAVVADFDSLPE